MKKKALTAMIVLAVVVALCMFFSGTVRTITTPKVRFTSAKQGKFEAVTELTGKVYLDKPEEIKLALPEDITVTVRRMYAEPGQEVREGDRLLTTRIVDYDKKMEQLRSEYDSAQSSLRNLERKSGEIRLSRGEQSWMDAYYTSQQADQRERDARVEAMARLSAEKLEMPESGIPEGASEKLTAALEELRIAEEEAKKASAELEKLNRYAIAESVWTEIEQRREYREKMEKAEKDMTELTLLARSVETVRAQHDGYIAEILHQKGDTLDADTVVLTMSSADTKPVLRAELTEKAQNVTEGASVRVAVGDWGFVETVITGTGVSSDGKKHADAEINRDLLNYYGSVSYMMQEEDGLKMRLTTRARESTCLLPPSAVRDLDGDAYVYIAERESSAFGGTQLKVVKRSVKVLNKSDAMVSVQEDDLSYQQIIVGEDRVLNEGDFVMEYGE